MICTVIKDNDQQITGQIQALKLDFPIDLISLMLRMFSSIFIRKIPFKMSFSPIFSAETTTLTLRVLISDVSMIVALSLGMVLEWEVDYLEPNPYLKMMISLNLVLVERIVCFHLSNLLHSVLLLTMTDQTHILAYRNQFQQPHRQCNLKIIQKLQDRNNKENNNSKARWEQISYLISYRRRKVHSKDLQFRSKRANGLSIP